MKTLASPDPGSKYRVSALFLFLLVASAVPGMSQATKRTPSEVLLVYNSTSPTSTAIANYYEQQRGVTNVLAVSCADSALNSNNETIAYSSYKTEIQTPISNYLASHSGINFIVLTKGIPIRIDAATTGSEGQGTSPQDYQPSLDSYLAALGYSTANGDVKASITGSGAMGAAWINKYYNATVPFTHSQFGGYLVTRLDAYTEANAQQLVDWATSANQSPSAGPVLLDIESDFGAGDKTTQPPAAPSKTVTAEESYDNGNADLFHAADILEASGIPNDTAYTNTFVGNQLNLLGYYSWGCNDDHFDPAAYETLDFAPGSIGDTYVSTSARTFLGQYAAYNSVNLNGATTFQARVAGNDSGGAIAIRLDSPSGPVIGTVDVPVTGGEQTWTTISCGLNGASGVHNVYIMFVPNGYGGNMYNLEWISFGGAQIEASSYSSLAGGETLETCSEGGQDITNIGDGQSLIADLIANGLTGSVGFVNEPTLNGISSPTLNISHYYAGYTLAESFYAGSPYLGWEGLVVGDPLCAPYYGAAAAITPTQASSYSGSAGGVATESCSESALDVGYISSGSYTYYKSINLAGINSFTARVASAGSGGEIQIRLNSPTGTIIGTCPVPVTGDWETWQTVTCNLTGASGTHTVYLVFTGGGGYLFNLEWFGFKTPPVAKQLVPGQIISLQSMSNGAYVSADNDGANPLIANRLVVGPWEQYQVVDAGSGNIALLSQANNLYVSADNGGANPLIADQASIGTSSTFTEDDLGGANIGLLSLIDGLYAGVDFGATYNLFAQNPCVAPWETFAVQTW